MARKARKKKIKVVYRQVECDPAEAQERLSRAFEMLFEKTLENYEWLKKLKS